MGAMSLPSPQSFLVATAFLWNIALLGAFGSALKKGCPNFIAQENFEVAMNSSVRELNNIIEAFQNNGIEEAIQVAHNQYTYTAAAVSVDGVSKPHKNRNHGLTGYCAIMNFTKIPYTAGFVNILAHPYMDRGFPCFFTVSEWLDHSTEQAVNTTVPLFFDIDTVSSEVASIAVQRLTFAIGTSFVHYSTAQDLLQLKLQHKLSPHYLVNCGVSNVHMDSDLALHYKNKGIYSYCLRDYNNKSRHCDYYLSPDHPTTYQGINAQFDTDNMYKGETGYFAPGARYSATLNRALTTTYSEILAGAYVPSCQPTDFKSTD